MVAQLHLHHIVRYRNDPAWPAPVWGKVPARVYTPAGAAEVMARLLDGLPADCGLVAAG